MNRSNENIRLWPLVASISILAALSILAGIIPFETLWGFNHLKYHPAHVLFIYILLFILILLPGTPKIVWPMLSSIAGRFALLRRPLRLLIVIAISAVVFYSFRVHVHTLGDGYQRIYQIGQGYAYYHTEVLDFFLHAVLYRIIRIFVADSGELTYILFSILGGCAFVGAVYSFRFPRQIESRLSALIKLLVITLGGIQLFFGYVESYTLYYIFSLFYLLFAFRFVINGRRIIVTSLLLALAMASHITALFLLPTAFYLLYVNFRKFRPVRFAQKYLPIIIVALPTLGILGQEIWLRTIASKYVTDIGGGILPLFSPGEYSVLSPTHLLDIFNQLLLVAPISVAAVICLYFCKDLGTKFKQVDVLSFLTIISALIFLLVTDPKLGFARDWDLFSIPSAAFGLALIMFVFGNTGTKKIGNYPVFLIGAASILFLSSWILTNASTQRQLVRAEDLLKLTDRGHGYGAELLAQYYKFEAKDDEKALEILQSITGRARNARVCNKIAKVQIALGRREDAMKSIYKGLEIDSTWSELQLLAGVNLTILGQPEKGLPHLLTALRFDPGRPEIHHAIANAYYRLDSLYIATLAFKEVLKLKPDFATVYFETSNAYRLMGQYDSALVYVKKGLRLNPNFPRGYKLLDLIKAGLAEQGKR